MNELISEVLPRSEGIKQAEMPGVVHGLLIFHCCLRICRVSKSWPIISSLHLHPVFPGLHKAISNSHHLCTCARLGALLHYLISSQTRGT